MALARARRSESGFNYWPGFVDALSTLVLSIVFLLSVFLVVQFFLSQEVTGKDKALEQLNAKIAQHVLMGFESALQCKNTNYARQEVLLYQPRSA